MARAIHKLEWLQVEEDLCRTALLEYLMEHEHWLWERPLSGGHESPLVPEPNQGDIAQRLMAVHALQDFGWFEESESSASH